MARVVLGALRQLIHPIALERGRREDPAFGSEGDNVETEVSEGTEGFQIWEVDPKGRRVFHNAGVADEDVGKGGAGSAEVGECG
jgi:hypothetical protein